MSTSFGHCVASAGSGGVLTGGRATVARTPEPWQEAITRGLRALSRSRMAGLERMLGLGNDEDGQEEASEYDLRWALHLRLAALERLFGLRNDEEEQEEEEQ